MNTISQELAQLQALEKFVKAMPKLPEGWEGSWPQDTESRGPHYVVVNSTADIKLTLWRWGDGTTAYKLDDGWRTFDRTGVENSFYWQEYSYQRGGRSKPVKVDFLKLMETQLARVAQRIEFHKTALRVPMIGYTISPKGLEEHKKQLAAKGHISFRPSGFGTGHNVVTRQPKHRYDARRATPELETFLGRSPLWVVNVDCD